VAQPLPAESVPKQWRGLTDSEARDRLRRYGPNTLPLAHKQTLFSIAFATLKEPMLVLAALGPALVLSVFLGTGGSAPSAARAPIVVTLDGDGQDDPRFISDLIGHFDDPKVALAEMVRILKPGGVLFAAVVPRKWFSLHRPMHRWLGPQVHRTRYGQEHYARWLKELGCVDVVTEGKGAYPPLFHNLPTKPRRMIERVFRHLDGTWVADRLGYFFDVAGRRGA
jgi:SAM-dependent methyltransferase